MTMRSLTSTLFCLAMAFVIVGCSNAPGKPAPGPEVERPEEIVSFALLYQQNCAGCHGNKGKGGAAISLANPLYLATAGAANIQSVISAGVPGTLMPAFAKQSGGMLTDQQITVLAQGMLEAWSRPDALANVSLPPYRSGAAGDPVQGQKIFATMCARCHGDAASTPRRMTTGSLLDPAYLALVSDQSLRSTIIAGRPELGMPDWRSGTYSDDSKRPGARDMTQAMTRAMTDQEITDTVAWITSHRINSPGQPYPKSQ